jgi:hypothetical protein
MVSKKLRRNLYQGVEFSQSCELTCTETKNQK